MFRLGVIEESLENRETLKVLQPFFFSQRTAQVPSDPEPVWHINEYHATENDILELLPILENQVKLTWYIHAFDDKKLIVILRGKSFTISLHKDATWDEMIEYGKSCGVGINYLKNISLDV